jgi:hypothetical protein
MVFIAHGMKRVSHSEIDSVLGSMSMRVMKVLAVFALGFTILTHPLHANGGGYFRGGVERAGDVAGFEPKDTEKIRILDEKLIVGLGPKSADVEVRYLMRNETGEKVKARFGFPVEESFDKSDFGGPPEPEGPRQLRYCKNYVIRCRKMAGGESGGR